MKKCSKCKENKPLSEFSKNKSAKDGLQHCCKACAKAYRDANKGRVDRSEYLAKWYQDNLDRISAKRMENKAEKAKYNELYYRQNREAILKQKSSYYSENMEACHMRSGAYRARKVGASVTYLPPNYKQTLFNFFGNKCMMPGCEKEITKANPLTEDHIIPISKGGHHAFYNLQVLCKSCNCSKNNLSTDDYRNGRMLLGAHNPKFNLWEYMQEHKQVIIRP